MSFNLFFDVLVCEEEGGACACNKIVLIFDKPILPVTPVVRNRFFKSSKKLVELYVLREAWISSPTFPIRPRQGYLEGSVASNEGGQLGQALLPTPPHSHLNMEMWDENKKVFSTSIMFPPGFLMIREILIRLMIASGKKTRSMLAPLRISLYCKRPIKGTLRMSTYIIERQIGQ